MHTIDDDTCAFELIIVSNNSKLKMKPGAVISGTTLPGFDLANNDSGLQVVEFSAAAIQVYDGSMLIVQGGVFGGEPFAVNPYTYSFENNWYSGAIAAFDQAKVIVQDGTFGTGAFRSGALAMFDDSRLILSGGTFTNPGGSGGRIELFDHADANISGGHHGASIVADGYSTLHISDGWLGKDDGFARGYLVANGFSSVRISGGTFGGAGYLAGAISIGEFSISPFPYLDWTGDPTIEIEGGQFGGSGVFSGIISLFKPEGRIEIKGSLFNFPFGPIEPAGSHPWFSASTSLMGVLSSGEVIETSVYKDYSEDAVIELIED